MTPFITGAERSRYSDAPQSDGDVFALSVRMFKRRCRHQSSGFIPGPATDQDQDPGPSAALDGSALLKNFHLPLTFPSSSNSFSRLANRTFLHTCTSSAYGWMLSSSFSSLFYFFYFFCRARENLDVGRASFFIHFLLQSVSKWPVPENEITAAPQRGQRSSKKGFEAAAFK